MTVQELIEESEELEPLCALLIEKANVSFVYDENDIEFVDWKTLNLPVKHYEIKTKPGTKKRYLKVKVDD